MSDIIKFARPTRTTSPKQDKYMSHINFTLPTHTTSEIVFDYARRTLMQGDVTLVPVLEFPKDVKPITGEISGPNLVVAHSETGHHHVVPKDAVEVFADAKRIDRVWMDIQKPVELTHLREQHTHAPQKLNPGKWLAQRQVVQTNVGTGRERQRLTDD